MTEGKMMEQTFAYDSAVGRIAVTATLSDEYIHWTDISFAGTDAFFALPDASYLEDLITYATLECQELKRGESLDFVLAQEDGADLGWCWADNVYGEPVQSIVFVKA
jgi:hypothetical protein